MVRVCIFNGCITFEIRQDFRRSHPPFWCASSGQQKYKISLIGTEYWEKQLRFYCQHWRCWWPCSVIYQEAHSWPSSGLYTCGTGIWELTHWSRNKMAATFLTTFLEWKSMNFEYKLTELCFEGPINNMPTLVQMVAWLRSGDKPSSEPNWMMTSIAYAFYASLGLNELILHGSHLAIIYWQL